MQQRPCGKHISLAKQQTNRLIALLVVAVAALTVSSVAWPFLVVDHVEAWKVGHVHGAKHVLGLLLDLEVDSRDIWDVVHAALTLLLLQLEGDSTHWALGDALHQVGKVSGNLVAESLRLDGCNLLADALVGGKVQGETLVVLLDNVLGSALGGTCPYSSHVARLVLPRRCACW